MTEVEVFPLVDEAGKVIGSATREECHANPALLHPVVHCIVRAHDGRWLLQLRSQDKDIQPGKWDTAVGGHIRYGERVADALVREVGEEIGLVIRAEECAPLHEYVRRGERESEYVYAFGLTHEGPFVPQPEEVDDLRFWTEAEIRAALDTPRLTPNFCEEFRLCATTVNR